MEEKENRFKLIEGKLQGLEQDVGANHSAVQMPLKAGYPL